MLTLAPPCTWEISGAVVTIVVADAFPNYRICGLLFSLSGEMLEREMLAHHTGAKEAGKRGYDTVAHSYGQGHRTQRSS